MARRREKNLHLPVRMYLRRDCYYHVSTKQGKHKWTRLGRDYHDAIRRYSELEQTIASADLVGEWRRNLYDRAKSGAKKRNIPFELSREDLDMLVERSGYQCAVTGIPFEAPVAGTKSPWTPSLDRIDSNLGYSFENCRLVCVAVNYALNQWGTDVLLRIADGIRANAAPDCIRVYKELAVDEIEST